MVTTEAVKSSYAHNVRRDDRFRCLNPDCLYEIKISRAVHRRSNDPQSVAVVEARWKVFHNPLSMNREIRNSCEIPENMMLSLRKAGQHDVARPEQPTPQPPQPEIPPGGPGEPHLPSPGPEPLPVPGPTDPALPRPVLVNDRSGRGITCPMDL